MGTLHSFLHIVSYLTKSCKNLSKSASIDLSSSFKMLNYVPMCCFHSPMDEWSGCFNLLPSSTFRTEALTPPVARSTGSWDPQLNRSTLHRNCYGLKAAALPRVTLLPPGRAQWLISVQARRPGPISSIQNFWMVFPGSDIPVGSAEASIAMVCLFKFSLCLMLLPSFSYKLFMRNFKENTWC